MTYLDELQRKLQILSADVRTTNRLVELAIANEAATPQQEIDNDMPAYLVFMILANVRKLKQISPDHILVKAVQAVCDLAQQSDEVKEQLPLDL